MSKWLYQTSDKQYAIEKYYNSEWKEIFGDDIVEYILCKYDKQLDKPGFSGYYSFRSEETFKDCINWLIKNKKITQEEYDEWVWKTVTDLDKFKEL